jgi:hypothetical protein
VAKLQHFSQLESLWLHHTQITDVGLASLLDLPNLQQLEVMETGVTTAGVSALEERLPRARVLQ